MLHENWFCRVCYLPQFTDSFFSAVDSNQSYLSNSSDNSLMASFIEDNSRIDIAGENNDTEEAVQDPFQELRQVRSKCRNNIIITYLNINSLRYKLMDIGEILYDKLTDYRCVFLRRDKT